MAAAAALIDNANPSQSRKLRAIDMGETTFQCSACGRTYRWKQELAGRKFKCACGAVIEAPARPAEEDLYDVAPAAAPVAPAAPKVVSSPAAPTLSYQTRSAAPMLNETKAYFPDKLKDLQLPLVFLVGGVAVEFIARLSSAYVTGSSPLDALRDFGLGLLIDIGLMLPAIFFAARFRGINFGRFWTALLKLSAISVAPSALMIVMYVFLRYLPILGDLLVLAAGFCFYFALIGAFFDLDQSDTWYCVVVIFLIKVLVYVGLRFVQL